MTSKNAYLCGIFVCCGGDTPLRKELQIVSEPRGSALGLTNEEEKKLSKTNQQQQQQRTHENEKPRYMHTKFERDSSCYVYAENTSNRSPGRPDRPSVPSHVGGIGGPRCLFGRPRSLVLARRDAKPPPEKRR